MILEDDELDTVVFVSAMTYLVPKQQTRATLLHCFLGCTMRQLNRQYRSRTYTVFMEMGRQQTVAVQLDSLYYVKHLVQQVPWTRKQLAKPCAYVSVRTTFIAADSMRRQKIRTCPHVPLVVHKVSFGQMQWFARFRQHVLRWHKQLSTVHCSIGRNCAFCKHPRCRKVVYVHMQQRGWCSAHYHHHLLHSANAFLLPPVYV